jgi:hypothetical protein
MSLDYGHEILLQAAAESSVCRGELLEMTFYTQIYSTHSFLIRNPKVFVENVRLIMRHRRDLQKLSYAFGTPAVSCSEFAGDLIKHGERLTTACSRLFRIIDDEFLVFNLANRQRDQK